MSTADHHSTDASPTPRPAAPQRNAQIVPLYCAAVGETPPSRFLDPAALAGLRTAMCGALLSAGAARTGPAAEGAAAAARLLSLAAEGLTRALTFHPRGAASFDEAWLLAIIEALQEADGERARTLVAFRIPAPLRADMLREAARLCAALRALATEQSHNI